MGASQVVSERISTWYIILTVINNSLIVLTRRATFHAEFLLGSVLLNFMADPQTILLRIFVFCSSVFLLIIIGDPLLVSERISAGFTRFLLRSPSYWSSWLIHWSLIILVRKSAWYAKFLLESVLLIFMGDPQAVLSTLSATMQDSYYAAHSTDLDRSILYRSRSRTHSTDVLRGWSAGPGPLHERDAAEVRACVPDGCGWACPR